MYDGIIIGGGPAGSAAAMRLAGNGLRVLLVERMKLPRDKSCSGVLIKKSVDLVRSYFETEIPESAQCKPYVNKGMVFFNDEGKEYRFEQEGFNIWRSAFDHFLLEKCQEAGVEIREETAALSCEEQGDYVAVTLKSLRHRKHIQTEKAKSVIVCEGAGKGISRKIRGCEKDYIVTYQTFNRGTVDLDHHYFYAFLQPHLSEYDAWFNVKDDYLILGTASADISRIARFHEEFINYMKTVYGARITETEKFQQWIMPRVAPGCEIDYGTGRILFAGECAGFLNPMGEGISCGMESGWGAAGAVIETIKNGNDNWDGLTGIYQENIHALREYMIRQWRFVGNISRRFSNFVQ